MTRKVLFLEAPRARAVLYGVAAVCFLFLLYFIGSELYGNYIAAQWEAAGYPDLRGDHAIWFWIKALAAAGVGLIFVGLAARSGRQDPTENRREKAAGKKKIQARPRQGRISRCG